MKKERKVKDFLKTPVFKGGIKAMKAFVSSQLKYPEAALREKVEGSVHLKYTVNNRGKVIRVKVVSGIGHGCDEEAQRIVKMMKFDVSKGGKSKFEYQKNISIHFRLPKQKQPETIAPTHFTYSVSSRPKTVKKKDTPAGSKPGNSYSYTVKF